MAKTDSSPIGVFEYVGERAVVQSRQLLQLAGLTWAVLVAAGRLKTWRRTVRLALARQILASGVEGAAIVCFLGLALGVLLVVQYQAWVGKIIQSQLLGPVVVVVVIRELGPLLVNLIVIARSGNAIATELGLMHVSAKSACWKGRGLIR